MSFLIKLSPTCHYFDKFFFPYLNPTSYLNPSYYKKPGCSNKCFTLTVFIFIGVIMFQSKNLPLLVIFSVNSPKLPFSKVYDTYIILKKHFQRNLIFLVFFVIISIQKIYISFSLIWEGLSNCFIDILLFKMKTKYFKIVKHK